MSRKKGDCIFCKIIKKEIPAAVEHEDESIIAFKDITPQAPVHILIVSKKHIGRVSDITAGNIELVGKMVTAANRIARRKGVLEAGYRLVINCGKEGGQLIEHFHMHLLAGRELGWPPG